MMRKNSTLIVLLLMMSIVSYGQQDAMFTKYMFNSLSYNPAYAGAKDHMAMGLLHRTQWWGIEGAPNSQTLTMHTPLKNDRVGVGLALYNDVIGPTNNIGANLSYAYRIPMGAGKLAIGIQGGIDNWRADWTKLTLPDNSDPSFSSDTENLLQPNFGTGLYYYSRYFYVGASVPRLIEYDRRDNVKDTEIWARSYRHYYFMLGGAIPLNGDALIFKPSILIKNVGLDKTLSKDADFKNIGAPTEFDVDLSFMFYQALWVGASFRSAIQAFDDTSSFDSFDIWASYYLRNGLRIGAAYDYSLTKLQSVAKGSFEVMLGYEFNFDTQRTVTPRYF